MTAGSRHLFGPEGRAALDALATRRTLIALDYDGTLAPIVPDPAQAIMRPRTRTALIEVARRHPTAIISGRGLPDVAGLVAGVPVACIVGNHGLEWDAAIAAAPGRAAGLERIRDRLRAGLPAGEGFVVEDKRLTLAVHYRLASDHAEARARVEALLAGEDVRVMGGKCVVNVLPRIAVDKGAALRHLMGIFACARALFVGDDVTDEDAFALDDQAIGVVGVRVGPDPGTRATYHLRVQDEVDDLLEHLASSRAREQVA